jgi:phage FluMu gp28-like protein
MGNAKIVPANAAAIFLPYQAAWVKDTSRLKLMEKARQIGLSWSTAYAAVERTAMQGARFDQWVSSRDDLQARLFIEDCRRFAAGLQSAAEYLGERVIDEARGVTAYVLNFANGRRIHSMSSNPDAQAGKRGGRVLDEFALHPDPRKLWSIAYPGITWGGNMELISTHRGTHNFFNQLIREARESGNPKGISIHRITLQDALDQGFLYKLQAALPQTDPIQAMDEAAYYDYIRAGCADEESFQQEYCCNPADDDAAFLEYDLIASCEYASGEAWEKDFAALEQCRGRLFAGLDIGRKNDLTVLWILEQLGDVYYTRRVITLKKMSKPDQERVLWPYLELASRVALDYTGLGIGWGDDAQRRFGEQRIDLVTFTPRVKEELAFPLRGAMEDRKLRIPYDKHIRADLRAVTKSVSASGAVRFTAERSVDGHADRFWALALALAAASSGTQYACTGYRGVTRREVGFTDWGERDYSRRSF